MALASDESRVPLETQYYARNDLQFLKQWPKLIILSLNFPLIVIVFLYVLILYDIILYYIILIICRNTRIAGFF